MADLGFTGGIRCRGDKSRYYIMEEGNNKYDTTEESVMVGEYRERLVRFLEEALELQ